MNIDEIIGNNLKKYRTAYNMTLKDLSEQLHKSISTISKYEKGNISLDMPTFIELAHIFDISPSLLLGEAADISQEENNYSSFAETLYMYTYNSACKVIVRSVIERYPDLEQPNAYRVQLFNEVKDMDNPSECGGLYTGEYISEGFIGTYMLRNQIMESEHAMISCVNNLVNPDRQLGLVTGLSNYTMLPVTFKTIISRTKIGDREELMELLMFSKEDFKLMKKNHSLTVQNYS